MRTTLRIGFAAAALSLALGACQGSFGNSGETGVPGGMNPPVNGPAPGQMNPSPAAMMTAGIGGSPLPSGAPAQNVSYPFSDAPNGLQCPEQDGYTCKLYFNMSDEQLAALEATPSPKSKNRKATATPSPTPTPSPDPSPTASSSGSPSPSPTPGETQMAISLSATPHDAPAMANPNPKAVATVPLVALRLNTTGDVLIDGNASARFTLPKEQIGGRGFAIQLFHETVKKKTKHDDFIGSYKQSHLSGNELIFTFKAPKLQVNKGDTWLVVLYGDELPAASGSPSASASPGSSASPLASPMSSFAPDAVPSDLPSAMASPTP